VRQRQVEVEPLALPLAALVGMAEEIRILHHGVGVDVHHLHVAAAVEDRLRPVAVVIVDVEHADPRRPLQPQPFGRHGGVIDEAVSPREARARMVPGRAAERKG
jgi:hypothetical protein